MKNRIGKRPENSTPTWNNVGCPTHLSAAFVIASLFQIIFIPQSDASNIVAFTGNNIIRRTSLVSKTGAVNIHHSPIASTLRTSLDNNLSKLALADSPDSEAPQYSLDPDSEEAKQIISTLGITQNQHETLISLSSLVVEWNEKINLISRKDCSKSVVFGRHVLPSLALSAMDEFQNALNIIDVGTGGGFPGLPLAIVFPEKEFLLVDSVGKKLVAVQGMIDALGLTNVQIHHGRAEELASPKGSTHKGKYDICLGRSVAALPKFCFWISDLIKKSQDDKEGKLLYIIGGDLETNVQSGCKKDIPIQDLLGDATVISDKRVLLFGASQVRRIANESGESKRRIGSGRNNGSKPERKKKLAKGAWVKRDNATPKQRGYENFKRYDSID